MNQDADDTDFPTRIIAVIESAIIRVGKPASSAYKKTLSFLLKKTPLSADEWVQAILAADRVRLGQAITLVESSRPDHRELAEEILEKCLPIAAACETFRLGISGAPGVGKSTFIENYGRFLLENSQKRLAVLAIDPSSSLSRGSILGDKTRMEFLSSHSRAFVRPSPAGDSLGGVARRTREIITLVEAAGFDEIFVETVGVGQSETAVHSMTDCFLLLLLPGAGDELQGIKRGIVEMADFIFVNKSDGERQPLAKQAAAFYRNALHLFPPKNAGWSVPVLMGSALENEGLAEVLEAVDSFKMTMKSTGFFERNRQSQAAFWLRETLENGLKSAFFQQNSVKTAFSEMEKEVLAGRVSPFQAAEKLLQLFFFKNEKGSISGQSQAVAA